MPRDKRTLTDGQWEHLGSLICDFIWDKEEIRSLIAEYFDEAGIKNEERITVLFDETLQRVEAGFARNAK